MDQILFFASIFYISICLSKATVETWWAHSPDRVFVQLKVCEYNTCFNQYVFFLHYCHHNEWGPNTHYKNNFSRSVLLYENLHYNN